jgi:hypothetical protein
MKMIQVGFVTCMGELRNAYVILVMKPERKKSLGSFRHRWNNIFDLEKLRWLYVYWVGLECSSGLL